MNAIALLKKRHDKVKKALTKISKGEPTTADELRELADELVAHMVIEEHIFYPQVKELMHGKISESYEEHVVARFELARLILADGTDKKMRAKVLKEILEHHIKEEEETMLPRVAKAIPAKDLLHLGEKMERVFNRAVEKGFAAFFPTTASPGRYRRHVSAEPPPAQPHA